MTPNPDTLRICPVCCQPIDSKEYPWELPYMEMAPRVIFYKYLRTCRDCRGELIPVPLCELGNDEL